MKLLVVYAMQDFKVFPSLNSATSPTSPQLHIPVASWLTWTQTVEVCLHQLAPHSSWDCAPCSSTFPCHRGKLGAAWTWDCAPISSTFQSQTVEVICQVVTPLVVMKLNVCAQCWAQPCLPWKTVTHDPSSKATPNKGQYLMCNARLNLRCQVRLHVQVGRHHI